MILHSRIAPNDLANDNPWRADLMTLPEPSYRASPGLVLGLLAAGAVLLGLAGLLLAYWAGRGACRSPSRSPSRSPCSS